MKTVEPVHNFYSVTIAYPVETSTGKVKKVKETHLVDAIDPTDVHKKVMEIMSTEELDWEITQMSISPIKIVYGECVK